MKANRLPFVVEPFVIGLLAAGLLFGGWSSGPNEFGGDVLQRHALEEETVGTSASDENPSSMPDRSPAQSATVYRASLEPIDGSGVTGEAMVRVKEDKLLVSVNATGLKASVEHAQHLHAKGICSPLGSPLVSLDDDLANNPGDATNAETGDDSFPTATQGGTVNYRQSASKSAVESALGERLNLAKRTVVVHKAGSPIGDPAACGTLNLAGK